jgi:malonate transporter and related proteins
VTGVLEGFATVGFIIGVGLLLAHARILDASAQRMLATLTFYVASPALLITMLQDADVHQLFSGNLIATGGAVAVSGLLALGLSRARSHDLGRTVISMLSACYVNGANLGIPIAVYVIGDATAVVPTILLQLVLLQPIALTLLDVAVAGQRLSWRVVASRPFKNPMTIASAAGLAMALTGLHLPGPLFDPIQIIGQMSVPGMLIAYGISLRLGPLPGRGVPATELAGLVALKMAVQPVAAYVIGRLLGLSDHELLTVTVLAGLPTAQNVFVMAVRYQRSVTLARDAVFVTTLAAIPQMLLISALLT